MIQPFRFYTDLRVRFNETDAQGHVNFAWYLNYFDIALLAYLHTLGYSYSQMLQDGQDMLYIDAHAVYQAPAYYDDLLRIHCRIGKLGNTSMRFDFQIFKPTVEHLVATGEITVVCAQRDTYEKLRVPEVIRQAVAAYESAVQG
ncbi:MAG: acyl-CoA thioesterase [Anaerolineales bacterium]|nr:MAG: acyl-CoA thioesterase [Anaerolineales bacterium]